MNIILYSCGLLFLLFSCKEIENNKMIDSDFIFITHTKDTLIFKEQNNYNLDTITAKNDIINNILDSKQYSYLYQNNKQFVEVRGLKPLSKYNETDHLLYLLFTDYDEYYNALVLYIFDKKTSKPLSSFYLSYKGGDAENFITKITNKTKENEFLTIEREGQWKDLADTCLGKIIDKELKIRLKINVRGDFERDTLTVTKNIFIRNKLCN
ncbi:MAG: hypothetical protein MUC49_06675 [Raineya sp.]|jgi:hypothetical protein|nr:hypothetical protein [Raineya sp.]